MKVDFKERKSKVIRENGRSADFTTPNFVMNCPMLCAYCYQHRHNESIDLNVATNVDDLLQNILKHRNKLGKKVPNQCDRDFFIYDIGCNTDISRVAKYFDWQKVFQFAVDNDVKFTFATKWFNQEFLSFNPMKKVRIRLSLLPERMIKVMDKGTHSLDKRLQAMQKLDKAGYEIHVNFSPIIVYDNWLEEYKELFQKVKALGLNNLECECIFLTHNAQKHLYNAEHYSEAEEYLWTPDNQESKTSLYGGDNIRYHWQLKNNYVSQFKKVLNEELPDMKVRYIF
jgi:spore photoproduct lyase